MPKLAVISKGVGVGAPPIFQYLKFLASQAWHDALIEVKFRKKEHTTVLLFYGKHDVDLCKGVGTGYGFPECII